MIATYAKIYFKMHHFQMFGLFMLKFKKKENIVGKWP